MGATVTDPASAPLPVSQTDQQPQPVTVDHPFQVANFRRYLLSRLCLMLSQYAMLLIIGWQTYNIARDGGASVAEASGALGLIGLFQFLPLFVLTPFSGLAADRFDRRRIGQATVLLQLSCATVLALTTASGATTLGVLYGVAGVLGVARGFAGPAMSALAPNLVPKAILPTAIALSSIAWQVGMIAGPALGGIAYRVDPALPYGIAAGLFTLSFVALTLVGKVPQPALRKDQRPIGQISDGLAYVTGNPMVLGTITLDLFAVFLAGATALFPVYARDILKTGEVGLALLAAAPGVGAMLTAAWFSWRPIRSNVGPKMLWSVAVFGVATILFGLSTWMPLSLAMLFVIGAADMFSVYIRQSLIQLHTPDDKRGRVSSVSQMTISASNEGGDFFSGGLAYLIGPVAALVAGGAGAIVTVVLWSRVFPVLRTTKTFDPPPDVLHSDQRQELTQEA